MQEFSTNKNVLSQRDVFLNCRGTQMRHVEWQLKLISYTLDSKLNRIKVN